MSGTETGANAGFGERPEHRPRHEAADGPVPELDVGLLATIAATVQVYMLRNGEGAYSVPPREEYHGRHRAEDRVQEAAPEPENPPPEPEPEPEVSDPGEADVGEAAQAEATPIFDRLQMQWGSQATRQAGVAPSRPQPQGARLAHTVTEQNLPPEPAPQPAAETPDEAAAPKPQPQTQEKPERHRGLLGRVRHAWYAGLAAVTTYFHHPEKGRRRRALAGTAAVLGGVATIGALAWLDGRTPNWHDNPSPGWTPYAAPPVDAPPPDTGQSCGMLAPHGYHGEQYEWTAAANTVGAPHATPHLQHLIESARSNGLTVDTWGDPDCEWGIASVTAKLPDGTTQTYYDTPRKLALLQWFASGADSGAGYAPFA